MNATYQDWIMTSEEFDELREELGSPSERAKNKVVATIDEHVRAYLAKSPFLTIATSDKRGNADVSPRGDAPGFVLILDDKHLFIPERPGNKRLDSARNIIVNPHIGLLFFIPGLRELLRVNGKAHLSRTPELLEKCQVNGKKPLFGILVEVEECYIHCAKAMIRSRLWEPSTWLEKEQLPSASEILMAHAQITGTSVERISEDLEEGYRKRLY